MAPDQSSFLAAALFSEGKIVTYRLLSRELSVHSNVAKRMLYDFYTKQNIRKSNSLYATYMLTGWQKTPKLPVGEKSQEDEDVPMQSSPYMGSSAPDLGAESHPQARKVITIAREDHVEVLKASYDELTSIHIYSIQTANIHSMEVLTDITRQVVAKMLPSDPLVVNKQFGIIQNQGVRRRSGRRPVLPTAAVVEHSSKPVPKSSATNDLMKPSTSSQPKPLTSRKEPAALKKANGKPPIVKREQSDLMKSFGRSKQSLSRGNTDSSMDVPLGPLSIDVSARGAHSMPVSNMSSEMPDLANDISIIASEDEQETDLMDVSKKGGAGTRDTRADRRAKLSKLMDEDDEIMEDAPTPADEEEAPEPADTTIPMDESDEAELEPPVTTVNGRRRGRRRVMKKKTIKDAEGYLVTKEEPAWESFSEDEPGSSFKARNERPSAPKASGAVKKSAAKTGQGTLMGFFGKK